MNNCPQCHIKLNQIKQNEISFFLCQSCKGILSTFSVLKKHLIDKEIKLAWAGLKTAKKTSLKCTSCKEEMHTILVSSYAPFSLCSTCHLAWFTNREKLHLPQIFQKEFTQKNKFDVLTKKERIDFATSLAESVKEIHSPLQSTPTIKQVVFSIAGLATSKKGLPTPGREHLTTILLCLMLIVTAVFHFYFKDSKYVDCFLFKGWGFFDHFGLSFILSFFTHSSLLHLISNFYYLRLIGPTVEKAIGKKKFLLLIFCSDLVGNILFSFLNTNLLPTIGASGGIMGILTFYALTFPKEKFGFYILQPWWRGWIWFPAWVALFILILQNIVGYSFQTGNALTQINYLSHLGGIIIGLLFWVKKSTKNKL